MVLARVFAVMRNEAKVHKDSERKVGHHVHNSTKWVRQQLELHPLNGNLHVNVDRSGHKNLGFLEPSSTCPQVESPDPSQWAGPSREEARETDTGRNKINVVP